MPKSTLRFCTKKRSWVW